MSDTTPAEKPKGKNPRITDAMRKVMVTKLACFETPSDVRDYIEAEFGVRLSLTTIVYYNPETADTDLAPKWKKLFEETRKRFINDTSRVAIAHRSARLRELERNRQRLEERLNDPLVKKNPRMILDLVNGINGVLKQAAEDVGDAYTNKRMLLAGDPEVELAKSLGWTVEELRAAIAAEEAAK